MFTNVASFSIPIPLRCNSTAPKTVVPVPEKGSRIVSPMIEYI